LNSIGFSGEVDSGIVWLWIDIHGFLALKVQWINAA
jgi:hypothetical protein